VADNVSDLKCIKKAKLEAEKGRLWRAKEILRGNLNSHGYCCELFEEYGKLLLLVHEDVEAGKYFFLSGVREEEYQEAIGLFLGRFGSSWKDLLATFPNVARMACLEEFPDVVAQHLESIGASRRFLEDDRNSKKYSFPVQEKFTNEGGSGCLLVIAFLGAAIVLLLAIFAGGIEAIKSIPWWVWLVVASAPGLLFAAIEIKK
jgi:hypothetical protein